MCAVHSEGPKGLCFVRHIYEMSVVRERKDHKKTSACGFVPFGSVSPFILGSPIQLPDWRFYRNVLLRFIGYNLCTASTSIQEIHLLPDLINVRSCCQRAPQTHSGYKGKDDSDFCPTKDTNITFFWGTSASQALEKVPVLLQGDFYPACARRF